MKRRRIHRSILFGASSLFLFIFTISCVATPPQPIAPEPTPEERFDAGISRLIDDLIARQANTPAEIAPAAVMSGSFKTGVRFTRLDELILERLALRLRKQHDIYSLSRQNWFEFREGRPLTFAGHPRVRRDQLRDVIVYEAAVSASEVLKKITVNIVASDADGQALPGMVADAVLDFSPQSPAHKLYAAAAKVNPFPEGLEERPYQSVDRLGYSLSAELTDAYRTGITADGQKAADADVRVLLYTKPSGSVTPGAVQLIESSLQQSIVAGRGFTCAVSQEDFGPAFHKIDFYQQNKSIFELEETRFTAGTVLLMADLALHPAGDKIGVALRALWRVSPLESETGALVPTNVAGTYLSGFTAKAYLRSSAIKVRYPKSEAAPPKSKAAAAGSQSPQQQAPAFIREMPARDTDICFYEFSGVYEKRIYPVLSRAPGVADIRRVDALCEDKANCLCYDLAYQGTPDTLAAYLRQNLLISDIVPFRLVAGEEGRLEVYFHSGFD